MIQVHVIKGFTDLLQRQGTPLAKDEVEKGLAQRRDLSTEHRIEGLRLGIAVDDRRR